MKSNLISCNVKEMGWIDAHDNHPKKKMQNALSADLNATAVATNITAMHRGKPLEVETCPQRFFALHYFFLVLDMVPLNCDFALAYGWCTFADLSWCGMRVGLFYIRKNTMIFRILSFLHFPSCNQRVHGISTIGWIGWDLTKSSEVVPSIVCVSLYKWDAVMQFNMLVIGVSM